MTYIFKGNDLDSKPNIKFIDGLRGIAILLVIFHHAGEILATATIVRIFSSFGKYGVQLFFVMSAFTMCYTGFTIKAKRVHFIKFYLKRIFRIAPLYLLAIPVYYLLAVISERYNTVLSFSTPATYTLPAVLSNVFFLHGFYPPGNNSIVPGGWSIGCEMIFYAIFPCLIIITRKSLGYLIIPQILATIAVVLLLYMAKLYHHKGEGGESSFAYYFIANQMVVFIIGILLFFLWESCFVNKYLGILGIICILVLIFTPNKYEWTYSPLLTAIVSASLAKFVSKKGMYSFIYSIGKLSYSMYITHFLFVWLASYLCHSFNFGIDSNLLVLSMFFFIAGGTFLVSKLTYLYIEMPMVDLGRKFSSRFGL